LGFHDLFESESKQYKVYTKRQVATPRQLDFSMRSAAAPIDVVDDIPKHTLQQVT
jgi:hypothetical protein